VGIKDLDEYWEMQPVRFVKYVSAFKKKKKMQAEEQDVANFNLGRYIMIAYHKPKIYPKKPFLYKSTFTPMTDEEMSVVMKKNTLILGGEINDT
jgi:hypothetical protein